MTGRWDRIAAAAGLVATSPVVAVCALGVKLSSPGPVLHRSLRAGQAGEPFTMYKLRTMHDGAEAEGRITAGRDTRVFGFGRFLRRTKLDEIPQLVNVLRGEMALVGPRPEDLWIVQEHYDALMWETLTVPPGLTSPGSLHYFGGEGRLPREPQLTEAVYLRRLLPRKIALDLVYVRNRSPRYAAELLLRTAMGVLGLRQAFLGRSAEEQRRAEEILAGWRVS